MSIASPTMRRGLPAEGNVRTALRLVVLALLSKEPNTGYGLGRLLRGPLCHLWQARLQQIYTELGKLEKRGLVVPERIPLANRPTKKLYSLTAAGYDALDSWLAEPLDAAPPRDGLLIRMYCLERMPQHIVLRQLEDQRRLHEDKIREVERRLDQERRSSLTSLRQLGEMLALEASLAQETAQATWCTKALSLVEQRGESLRASNTASMKASGQRAVA